jgi:NPCBM/NEW2 domain/F5/8 type C domain
MEKKIFIFSMLAFLVCQSGFSDKTIDLEIKPDKNNFPVGWKLMGKKETASCFKVIKKDDNFILHVVPPEGKKGSVSLLSADYLVDGAKEVQISMDFHGRGIAALTLWLMDKNKRHLSSLVSVSSWINGQHRSRTKKASIPEKIKGRKPTYIILRLSVTKGSDITITNIAMELGSSKKEAKATVVKSPSIAIKSIFDYGKNWKTGEYWKTKTIGKKDFYLAEAGNYVRVNPQGRKMLYQVGLLKRIIPGHWSLKYFDPTVYDKASPNIKKTVDEILQDGIPLATVNYQMMKGNKAPSIASLAKAGHLWIGDGQPEEPIYRTEPIFHFLKTAKKWRGSSSSHWKDAVAVDYLKNKLLPALRKALPGCDKPGFRWNRANYKKMCDIYVKTYLDVNECPLGWTMFLSPYLIASMPKVKTIATKGGDARLMAEQRGALRQAGGNKFTLNWRGHEPLERYVYIYHPARLNRPSRDGWGYPLSHIKHYIFRPYLLGSNYASYECFSKVLTSDIENDKKYRLSKLGYEVKNMLDFVDRVKDRGTVYTPAALIRGWDREGCKRQRPYSGRIAHDDADNMNNALVNDMLLPEHWASKNTGEYSCFAPYGELFDILRPDYTKTVDSKIFDGYKLLFMLGGVKLSQQYADVLKEQVQDGKLLVINAADALKLKKYLANDLLGVEISAKKQNGTKITETASKHVFKESSFKWYTLKPGKNTKTLYTCNNKPLITLHKYGKGGVIVIGVRYMQKAKKELHLDRRHKERVMRKKLLSFVPHFFRSLLKGTTPFEIKAGSEAVKNLTWVVKKTKKGWRVIVFNYDVERDNKLNRVGTASFNILHPYKAIPFEVVCNAPMQDVVELYSGRNVNWKKENGKMVVKEKIPGGEILVYDFQSGKIKLPAYKRYVNYALRKPVKASTTYKDLSASFTVDGDESNENYWASGYSGGRYGFKLPESLEVDLGAVKTINHIWLKFHTWKFRSIDYRRTIYKYYIESSEDGKSWKKIVDESKNWDDAAPNGIETWFKPEKARYIKLTVLDNTSYAGARVCEIKVMGDEQELYQPKRKTIKPKWQVEFPDEIYKAKRMKYLRSLKPSVKPQIGWMPAGKTWKQLNGWVRLYTDINSPKGLTCTQSIYAEAPSEIIYKIPNGAKYFITVPGLGNRHRQASVEFRIFVDNEKKYDSGYFKVGNPLDAVMIDVTGAKELKLIVTDGGNGLAYDYSWWGDARFILKDDIK